jgi:hypothetical protein
MCDLFKCKHYASLFDERVRKQRKVIAILLSLALSCFFVGISLILLALFLGDLKQNLTMEIIKTSLGLIITGTSVATWKEVLDRWLGLIPFANVRNSLADCESLRPEEAEFTCGLAEKILAKL